MINIIMWFRDMGCYRGDGGRPAALVKSAAVTRAREKEREKEKRKKSARVLNMN
jgi:hypothetical protein